MVLMTPTGLSNSMANGENDWIAKLCTFLYFIPKRSEFLHGKFVVQKCFGHNDLRDGPCGVIFFHVELVECAQALQRGDARDAESPLFDLSSS